MLQLSGFSTNGAHALMCVYGALARHAPTLVQHFQNAALTIRFEPALCQPGAAACAREDRHREIIFVLPPEHMSMLELGRVLLHEAQHWQQDERGRWYVFPHICSDPFCRIEHERRNDPVYAHDAQSLQPIRDALVAAGLDPDAPFAPPVAVATGSPFLDLLKGAAIGVATIGGVLLLGSALDRRWDPAVGRHRRSNGQFV